MIYSAYMRFSFLYKVCGIRYESENDAERKIVFGLLPWKSASQILIFLNQAGT